MNEKSVFLVVGVADIFLSYFLFTNQHYFSLAAMLGVLAIVASGFAILVLDYQHKPGRRDKDWKLFALKILSIVSLVLIFYEAYYEYASGPYFDVTGSALPYYVALSVRALPYAVVSVLLFVFGIDRLSRMPIGRDYRSHAILLGLLAVLVVVLYLIQSQHVYSLYSGFSWTGSDEIAFNYYATRLFLQGANPYNASMMPILNAYNLTPTYALNGSCICSYSYPAMSLFISLFLALASGLTGQNFVYMAVLATIALIVFVSFLLYRRSEGNKYVLLLLAIWFLLFFYNLTAIGKYVSVSLFLVLAYIYRKRIFASGILLGLAASTNQLSWFALPFFYVLVLRESGGKAAIKSISLTAATFLVLNGYLIAMNPGAMIGNMLYFFTTKLQFDGISIMQLLVAFYPAPYWISSAMILIVFSAMLLLFYLYTDTLRPLLALTPIMIFFMSWRNLLSFTIPFLPLLILVYLHEDVGGMKDPVRDKKVIKYLSISVLVILASLIFYEHGLYTQSNLIEITNVAVQTGQGTTSSSITGMAVNVTNNADKNETISLYVVTKDPGITQHIVGTSHSYGLNLPKGSYVNYNLSFYLSNVVGSNTELYVFVLSDDYIQGYRTQI